MEKLIEINNIDNTKLVDKTYSKFYISVKTKFFINIVLSTILTLVAFSLSFPWIKDLSIILSPFASVFIISGIALLPGFMNAFLIVSLLSDKQPQIKDPTIVNDNITLLISAYNEEASIFNTLKYVKDQVYNGNIYTIVIDNNSN
ncbi:MAG: glycosyltransferase family 2 protein, partial [Paeniclostridium sordellii]|nr:glycosyltransferase family 2 protein [Paeniclostridium sordellii]